MFIVINYVFLYCICYYDVLFDYKLSSLRQYNIVQCTRIGNMPRTKSIDSYMYRCKLNRNPGCKRSSHECDHLTTLCSKRYIEKSNVILFIELILHVNTKLSITY